MIFIGASSITEEAFLIIFAQLIQFMTHSVLLFFNFGGGEIFIILAVVLLLFGSKKIPEFARGLGKGMRYLKDATDDIQRDIQDSMHDIKKDVDINKHLKDNEKNENSKS